MKDALGESSEKTTIPWVGGIIKPSAKNLFSARVPPKKTGGNNTTEGPFQKKNNTTEGRARKWRRDYSDVNVVEQFVVGREEDVKKLVGTLIAEEGDGHPNVICIHGMGGVGKTTLAKQIYRHSQVRSHFDVFAWSLVSDENWEIRDRTRRKEALETEILMQLTQTTHEEIEEIGGNYEANYLHAKLRAMGKKRRCLVVMDDVWMDFMSITTLELFKFSNIKVVLTTRNKPVDPPEQDVFSHELSCLDKKQSWELFVAMTNFRIPPIGEMKELAEKMLEYCAGLPLAITVLGDQLSQKQTVYEWQEIFHENFKSGTGVLFEQVLWILSLSYTKLPHELISCFNYLANFPKDCKIRMKELCQMFAADESAQRLSYRAEPYEYFKKLVERSLVQVQNLDFRGEIKTLRIHNLMRDVCCSKAKVFVKLLNSQNIDPLKVYYSQRISLYLNKDVFVELLPWIDKQRSSVHSLMCFTRLQHPSYEQVMRPLLNKFRKLRVLKFENVGQGYIGNLPEEIGELTELRFLSLKGSHVEQVPSSIGNLVNLETLDLRTKWTTELPNVIWKLKQLRHLYLAHRSHIVGNELMRFGYLRFLETLVNIPLICCDVNELNRMNRVTKLSVYFSAKWWKKIDHQTSTLFLVLVQSLALENSSGASIDLRPLISSRKIEKLRVEGKISTLVEENHFPMLMKLTLSRTYLADDPTATLEKLPNLSVLVLRFNAFTGSKMICSSGGFSRLKSLSVVVLENLEEWTIEEGAFPALGYLLIEDCHALEAIPGGLIHVTTLKKVVIKSMPEEFKTKLEPKGKDFDVVQHVAEIEFHDCESVSEKVQRE